MSEQAFNSNSDLVEQEITPQHSVESSYKLWET